MDTENNLVEVAIGSISNRGRVLPITEIQSLIKPETELYRSMFVLDSSAQECFDTNGTIRSYSGTYAIDNL